MAVNGGHAGTKAGTKKARIVFRAGFPEKGADLWVCPGNFRESLGNFRGTSGLALKIDTERSRRGTSMNVGRNFSGAFQKLQFF